MDSNNKLEYFATPDWKSDEDVIRCPICYSYFQFFRRKHHCRACGGIFCDTCSSARVNLSHLGYKELVRVCDSCVTTGKIKTGQNENNKQYSSIGPLRLSSSNEETDTLKDDEIKEWLLLVKEDVINQNQSRIEKLNMKVFKGIPNRLRGTIWPILSGSSDLSQKNKGVYQFLVSHLDTMKYKEQLSSDISRTYPEHSLFTESDGIGQRSLYNVLGSFSLMDPQTGYQQGMSYIAAILIMQMDEESSFWAFVEIMKTYRVNLLYRSESDSLLNWMKEFDKWFSKLLPKLYQHMKKECISFEIYAVQWIKTIYSYNFPLELIFRIWDVFFIEGMDFLIWVGLALLDQSEDDLLKMKSIDIMKYLQKIPDTTFDELLLQLKSQQLL